VADSSRRPRAVAAASTGALAALLAAGCAGVPTSGPVHVGRAVPAVGGLSQDDIRVLPAAPAAGASRRAVVNGFLGAAVDPDDDYSAARAYLAPGTAWNTAAGTTTYNQTGLSLTRTGSGTVQMKAPQVGTISSRGDYFSAPGTLTRRFILVRKAGQWRISRVPAGVLLATVDAQRSLEQETIYYLNPAQSALVPEQVLLPPEQPGTATTLIRALLSGPPAPLSAAVTTAAPSGTRLLGNVPVDANGVAEVDLSILLHPISADALRRLSAQIVWTLKELPDVTAVQLLVDGDPLIVPGFPRLLTTATWPSYDPDTRPGPSGVLYVHRGRVRSVGEPVPAALARLSGVRSPAIGAEGTAVAVLRQRGRELQLLMGPSSGELRVRLTAPTITAPSFDRAGDVIAAVQTPVGRRIVEVPTLGKPQPVGAPASLLAAGISDLALSPDGTRVALIVGPPGSRSLLLGLLGRRRGQAALVDVHLVLPASSDSAGLAWAGSGSIVTTTEVAAHSREVVETDTLGYSPHSLSATPFPGRPVEVADAAGERPYAVAAGTLYRLQGTEWQPLSTGTDPGYAG
jgi:hypothetical protein